MKCTSCDEEMVFIKENGGYLCPIIRSINRSGENKKLAVISNYLIIAAMVLVIVFFIVVGLDKH